MQTKLRTTYFVLLAIPAVFLPIAFVISIVWTWAVGIYSPPKEGTARYYLGWGFIWLDLAQMVIYMAWAACSKELDRKARLACMGLIYVANAFSIPCFLVCKYRRNTMSVIASWREFERRPIVQSISRITIAVLVVMILVIVLPFRYWVYENLRLSFLYLGTF